MLKYLRIFGSRRAKHAYPALAVVALLIVAIRWSVSTPTTSTVRHRSVLQKPVPVVDLEWHGIQKRIHQTWKTADLPADVIPMVSSWVDKNPDYEYTLYTDEDIEEYMPKVCTKIAVLYGVSL